MKAVTEAVYLPLLFLTVALLGGLRVADRLTFVPPPLFALVLGVMLFGVLVRGRVLAAERADERVADIARESQRPHRDSLDILCRARRSSIS